MPDRTLQKSSSNGHNPNSKTEIRGRTGFTELPNGLRIITFNSNALQTMGLGYGVDYGSINSLKTTGYVEPPHQTEHMVYQGTQDKKSLEIFESLADFCNDDNAEVLAEGTVFHIGVNKNKFEPATKLFADMTIRSTIPKDRLDNTQDVIIEERKEQREDPQTILSINVAKELYRDHELISRAILPSDDEIKSVTHDMIIDSYSQKYTPDKSVVTVVGAMSHHRMVDMIEKYFSDFRGKSEDHHIEPASVDHEYREMVVPNLKVNNASQSIVNFALKLPNFGPGADQIEETTSTIVSSLLEVRLLRLLREERGLVYSVCVNDEKSSFYGLLEINARTSNEKLSQAKDLIHKELASFSSGDITYEEFRKQRKREYDRAKSNSENNVNIATSMAALYLQHHDPFYWEASEEMMKNINIDQFREFCRKYLDPEKALVTTLVPHETYKAVA